MADTITPTKNFAAALSVSGGSIGTSGAPNVTDAIALGAVNQAELYVSFTKDTLTDLNIIVELSQDKQTWFQKTLLDIANGAASGQNFTFTTYTAVYQLKQTCAVAIDLPLAYAYFRLRVWGGGTAGNDAVVVSVGGGSV